MDLEEMMNTDRQNIGIDDSRNKCIYQYIYIHINIHTHLYITHAYVQL